jgi:hypothetical protein
VALRLSITSNKIATAKVVVLLLALWGSFLLLQIAVATSAAEVLHPNGGDEDAASTGCLLLGD